MRRIRHWLVRGSYYLYGIAKDGEDITAGDPVSWAPDGKLVKGITFQRR